jgi:hypothetical protein
VPPSLFLYNIPNKEMKEGYEPNRERERERERED